MKTAIHVLKRSIENVQNELANTQLRLDTVSQDKLSLEQDVKFLNGRLNELETAISTLEGTKDESAPTKSKKAKR